MQILSKSVGFFFGFFSEHDITISLSGIVRKFNLLVEFLCNYLLLVCGGKKTGCNLFLSCDL